MEKTTKVPHSHAVEPEKFSLIWLVPIIAAIVAAWLVWEQVEKMGPSIIVHFRDGSGLVANQTVVKYRGVRVGSVRSVKLSTDTKSVIVKIRLDRSATALARSGSLFWVVRPEVGAAGLHGLETIVSGPYIQVQPGGGDAKLQNSFVGLEEPPILPKTDSGSEFILSTTGIRSLAQGSPVFYRGMEVGSVEYLSLSGNSTTVDIHIFIKAKFVPLVRTDTIFWNAGGINMDLKFFGISFNAENLKSVVIGGIAFATPNNFGPAATNDTLFSLHDKIEDKWLTWSPSIILTNATAAQPANENISPLNLNP